MSEITFSHRALRASSYDQIGALVYMVEKDNTISKVHVSMAFELPDGYLSFEAHHTDGHSINGGISPEGEVST